MSIIQIALWAILITTSPQTTNGWKALVPLRSTRNDVERLLGSPTNACTELCRYDTRSERVFVRYSDEACKKGEASPLNIPPNTIVSMTVYPHPEARLRDLKLDERKFKKTNDPELHGYSTFTSRELGVAYEVSDKNMILSIEWFGAAKNIEALRCR